jgi:hypothetical protein
MRAKLLLFFVLVFVFSCGEDALQRTQVLLVIDGGDMVKARTQRVEVALRSGPVAQRAKWKTHTPEQFTDITWPASLALVPAGDAGDTGFEVVITAFAEDGTKIVENRVISSFVKLRTLLLEIVLEDACIMHFCGEAETCYAHDGVAVCQTASVNPKDLPEYTGPGKNRDDDDVIDGGRRDAGGDGDGDGDGDGPCVASGAEQCFNGKDDDCNGQADCADSACDPTSMCVPGGASTGVMVGKDAPCPEGYKASEQVLHKGLSGGGCEGCSCSVTATTCTASFYAYPRGADNNVSECTDDVYNMNGELHYVSHFDNTSTDPNDMNCPAQPLVFELGGWRVTTIVPTDGTCSPAGTSLPETPAWSEHGKLCKPAAVGKGCEAGQVCAPKLDQPRVCHSDEAVQCASDPAPWYVNYEDDRTCGSCRCTDGSGGNCADVQVVVGSDWACNVHRGSSGANDKECSYSYSPPVFLTGTPVNKSCVPTASVSGSLKPTGRVDLCCSQL